jgi:type IV pilus assembly protein PilM
MGRKATGIDVGSSSVRLVSGEVKGTSFVMSDFVAVPNPKGTLAAGWEALAGAARPRSARIGLSGRDVNVRYTRVPRMPDWQLKKLMRFEAEEVGGQSETRVASDFNLLPELPEVEGEDVVLLSLARESLLAEHLAGLAALGGSLDAFTPNAIALYNAFLHYGVVMEDTVLVASFGRENVDACLVRGTDLIFARNLSGGSKLFDEAIARRFEVDLARAERFKVEHGTLELAREFDDPIAEKAARAMTAPAGQILSLLQSAVQFAKSQIRLSTLKLDRVLLCGGGAALPGLPRYLQDALHVPVEIFDPFAVVDTSALEPEARAALEEHKLEAVCALGLATTASDAEAYSIEILPESLRKKRQFAERTVYLIAAACLLLGFLGLYAWRKHAELGELSERAARLSAEVRRMQNTQRETAALLEENAHLAGLAEQLFALEGAGECLVRVLAAIDQNLPGNFWIESLTLAPGFDDELGVPRASERPIVRLRGRSRESTESPTGQWQEFLNALRAALPEARIKDRFGESEFTLDLTTLAPRYAGAAPVPAPKP